MFQVKKTRKSQRNRSLGWQKIVTMQLKISYAGILEQSMGAIVPIHVEVDCLKIPTLAK